MFDLYTNFDVIFLVNLTDKIHYQIFDSLGRIVQVLVDNDGKQTTGAAQFDNNGNEVKGIDRIDNYKFNVRGEHIQISSDNNADGILDTIDYLVLNANGHTVEKYVDADAKVTTGEIKLINSQSIAGIDRVETYDVNAKGQNHQINYDSDANGVLDKIQYIQLNANGNWEGIYTDTDASIKTGNTQTVNGKGVNGIDQFETYVLNEKGRTIETHNNRDAEGMSESIVYIVRDSNGYAVKQYVNTDGGTTTGTTQTINGKEVKGINRIEAYEINAQGHGYKISYDNDADGIVDKINYLELNANGNWMVQYTDNDPNGSEGRDIEISGELANYLDSNTLKGIDEIIKYTRDAQGRTTSDMTDKNADGIPETIRYIELYPNGNWSGSYTNADGDTATGSSIIINGEEVEGIDRREIVYPDSRGYTIGRHWDDNMDGTLDRFQKVVVNGNGNWIELHTDSNNDGNYERSEFYTLDQYGRTSGITYMTYNQPVETLKALSDITAEDGRLSTNSYIRDVNGTTMITANDANIKDGLIDTLIFSANKYEVNISNLVGSDVFALGEINKSLTRITLSNDTAATTISLTSSTLAKISKNTTLDIRGDATDTVNLSNDFTKVEGTTKKAGTDVLQAYRTEVDGTTYTVYIDTDVDTVVG